MNKASGLLLLAATVLVAACGGRDAPRAASGDDRRVPDVVHMELRAGGDDLESAGYRVVLSDELGSKAYVDSLAEYLDDRRMGMVPEPHIGATEPAPGEAAAEGSTVTITAIECPEQAETCD